MTTTWTNERLSRVFQRYRVRYWPTSRRLLAYRTEAASLDHAYGQCQFQDRVLLIDLPAHSSDRSVRATLLHEMIHAVVGVPGHHSPFWAQLEYLLAQRAPISVGFPELGERGHHLGVIPARFRRCRRLFAVVYRRRQRQIERGIAEANVQTSTTYTTKVAETEAYDAAVDGAPWRGVWEYTARELGFVDLDERLLPWARRYRDAARRGYARGRRFHLEQKRLKARFEAMRQAGALNEGSR